jgi:hypothetical protein
MIWGGRIISGRLRMPEQEELVGRLALIGHVARPLSERRLSKALTY